MEIQDIINDNDPIIDLVVPYVDAADPKWQALYNMYNPNTKAKTEEVNALSRFRGQGNFFKYFFRAVAKNLPWINNIFLLVQSESQIPTWINRKKIHIVYHKEFIPAEYLPTFNSTCIEMFLDRIPELSEHFLYANDDMYVLYPMTKNMFFEKNKVKSTPINGNINSMYGMQCLNAYCIAYNSEPNPVGGSNYCLRMPHMIRPYLKSMVTQCFTEHKETILNSISKFRETKNINVYLFDHYMMNHFKQLPREFIKSKIISSHTSADNIRYILSLPKEALNMLCVEDNEDNINIYENSFLRSYFYSNFYNPCKYEL